MHRVINGLQWAGYILVSLLAVCAVLAIGLLVSAVAAITGTVLLVIVGAMFIKAGVDEWRAQRRRDP